MWRPRHTAAKLAARPVYRHNALRMLVRGRGGYHGLSLERTGRDLRRKSDVGRRQRSDHVWRAEPCTRDGQRTPPLKKDPTEEAHDRFAPEVRGSCGALRALRTAPPCHRISRFTVKQHTRRKRNAVTTAHGVRPSLVVYFFPPVDLSAAWTSASSASALASWPAPMAFCASANTFKAGREFCP